jgi:hypothetical protein
MSRSEAPAKVRWHSLSRSMYRLAFCRRLRLQPLDRVQNAVPGRGRLPVAVLKQLVGSSRGSVSGRSDKERRA